MSTVKISQLPTLPVLNEDTDQTLVTGVDLLTGITGKMTATTLARGLYSHNILNVGNTSVVFPNVVAQFVGDSNSYIQINTENTNPNGSADMVVTADTGDDETYYIDMGINNSNYNDVYTFAAPLDGYLVMQGDDANTPGGNLVIGTFTPGKDISFVNGSITGDKIVMKYVYEEGLHLLHNPIFFADGTEQNTAPATFAYSNAAFAKANASYLTTNTVSSFATGAFNKANAAYETANSAGAFANTAADAAATARIAAATADGKAVNAGSYANAAFVVANNTVGVDAFQNTNIGLAWTTANNALANATGTFGGDLTVAGNLVARSITTSDLISFASTSTPSTNALVEIIGSVGGAQVAPATDGYMLHVTGKDGVSNKIIFDSFGTGAYPLVAGRAARGSANTPLATQNNDVLMRVSSGGYANSFIATGSAKMDFVAAENFTDATRGTEIQFWNTVVGTNTLNKIVTFNATHAEFSGYIIPDKGFIYKPRIPDGNQTAITIDYSTDSMIKANLVSDLTVSHSNFVAGKVVEMWLVNSSGSNRTVTHGLAAINSTKNSTTFTIYATSSAYLRFFSIDGGLANTFVSVNNS